MQVSRWCRCLGGAGALLLLDCYDGSCHASMCALWHSEFAACSNYKQDESQTACSPGRGTRIPTSLLKRFTDRAYWRCRWSGSYQCMCLRRKAQYHTSTRSTQTCATICCGKYVSSHLLCSKLMHHLSWQGFHKRYAHEVGSSLLVGRHENCAMLDSSSRTPVDIPLVYAPVSPRFLCMFERCR